MFGGAGFDMRLEDLVVDIQRQDRGEHFGGIRLEGEVVPAVGSDGLCAENLGIGLFVDRQQRHHFRLLAQGVDEVGEGDRNLVVFAGEKLLGEKLCDWAGLCEWHGILHHEIGDDIAAEFFEQHAQLAADRDIVRIG